MNQVLFLCTGNFHRSRIAETMFNHLAQWKLPQWQAISRGLGINDRSTQPVSDSALNSLEANGIPLETPRFPKQIQPEDLLWSDRIIALNERDHRPTLENKYPAWIDRVEFWNVPDVDQVCRATSFTRIEANVEELISILRSDLVLQLLQVTRSN